MEIDNPHDKLFRKVFSNREDAIDLLKNVFPKDLLSKIDFDFFDIKPINIIDDILKETKSDLLIETKISRNDAFVYVLLDHKSYPDQFTFLQLLKYMVRIWEDSVKGSKGNKLVSKLPLKPIIPVMFYHSGTEWRQGNIFQEIYFSKSLPEYLEKYIPNFETIVYDLSPLPESSFKGSTRTIITLRVFKYIFLDILPHLENSLNLIDDKELESFLSFLKILTRYILNTVNPEIKEDIKYIFEKKSLGGVYMTIAEELKEEGKQEGMKVGEQKGKQEGMKIGEQKGIMERNIQIARNLKKKNLPLDLIAETTDLSIEEIKKL